ncbi:MAG: PRC-barrel domain-containing protein [Candidatus Altiarchaeota archaeon]
MAKKLSEFYGLDVYSVRGERVGKVEDVILNLDKGAVLSVCLKSLREIPKDPAEIRRVLTEECVGYDSVAAVGDIILVTARPAKDSGRKMKGLRNRNPPKTDKDA